MTAVTRGYDARKKVDGRKRFIVVDTLGLLLTVLVVPANRQDLAGAGEDSARRAQQWNRAPARRHPARFRGTP